MFGYIVINKSELKFREFDTYQSYYCGLCNVLKKKYGLFGQLTLSYDITFAAILLSSLYEPESEISYHRCFAHPFEKHMAVNNEILDYLVDMNVLLTMYKCEDDWKDERKLYKKIFGDILSGKSDKQRINYCDKEQFIAERLGKMSELEAAGNKDICAMAELFGEIMGEILCFRDDEWTESIRLIGFHLGRFIYTLDAYDDLENDIRKGNYNPLIDHMQNEDFEEYIHTMLTLIISDCCREFEILPLIENVEILRNILYSGVWERYEAVKGKRIKEKKR
ncbi:MAG: DUF5685 family protein [Lachnospiraceae bacterium]|nr:DUF5685 family protein [Lachnospiraceae bacterium]